MKINIEIVDRNYEQIREFCEFNNLKIEDYIVQCVEDDFFTRKYGDLNEKLKKEETKQEIVFEKTEEPLKTEKKKVGRPKKTVEEPKEEVVKEIVTNKSQVLIKKEEISDTDVKPTRIKRTLKAK